MVSRRHRASSAETSTPPTNGPDKPKQARKPRKPKQPAAVPPPAAAAAVPPDNGRAEPLYGKLLSEMAPRSVEWIIPDLVPLGTLMAVVGDPGTGKSTFGAWVIKQAGRAVVLPGNEEDAE